jgi:hypothetical protein
MKSDLAALTPPLLVAIVFLIAAGAFLRHEMRRSKNPGESQEAGDSRPDSTAPAAENETDQGSAPGLPAEGADDDEPGSDV